MKKKDLIRGITRIGHMVTIQEASKSEDPFTVLDSLLPPQKPTKMISEEEWQNMLRL